MKPRSVKQSVVWAVVLMLVGVLALINTFVPLGPVVWTIALGAAGLVALAVYLTDRRAWGLLITGYALLAIAALILLVVLDLLREGAVAVFVLVVIAIPFLTVFFRKRENWWALIPGYILLAVALMILLQELRILDEELTAPYVLFSVAIPFYVVFLRDMRQWWFLIPAGVLTIVGLSLLAATDVGAYVVPALLVVAGVVIIARLLMGGRRSSA